MSKSFKKYPIVRQERAEAHRANRYFRHNSLEIEVPPRGRCYRKVKNFGWGWAYHWSLEDAIKDYYESKYFQEKYETLEEYLIWYKKSVLSK